MPSKETNKQNGGPMLNDTDGTKSSISKPSMFQAGENKEKEWEEYKVYWKYLRCILVLSNLHTYVQKMGDIAFKSDQVETAIEWYTRAIFLYPDGPESYKLFSNRSWAFLGMIFLVLICELNTNIKVCNQQ